jgi:mannose-6-phosphate isomerase-like protein (cupin superfamily)
VHLQVGCEDVAGATGVVLTLSLDDHVGRLRYSVLIPADIMVEPEVVHAPLLHRALGTAMHSFVIEENEAPASSSGMPEKIAPLHRHRSEDEAWYVLEGALRFQYGAREFDAGAGSGVLLPRGTAHTFWNPGSSPARYLLIMGPKTAGLLDALHGPNRPAGSGLRQLFESFDIELLE